MTPWQQSQAWWNPFLRVRCTARGKSRLRFHSRSSYPSLLHLASGSCLVLFHILTQCSVCEWLFCLSGDGFWTLKWCLRKPAFESLKFALCATCSPTSSSCHQLWCRSSRCVCLSVWFGHLDSRDSNSCTLLHQYQLRAPSRNPHSSSKCNLIRWYDCPIWHSSSSYWLLLALYRQFILAQFSLLRCIRTPQFCYYRAERPPEKIEQSLCLDAIWTFSDWLHALIIKDLAATNQFLVAPSLGFSQVSWPSQIACEWD